MASIELGRTPMSLLGAKVMAALLQRCRRENPTLRVCPRAEPTAWGRGIWFVVVGEPRFVLPIRGAA